MSYSAKITAAETLLSAHYKTINEPKKAAELIEAIQKDGGTNEATLETITAFDLEELGVPKLLARRVAKAFGSVESTSVEKQIVIVDDNPVNLAARLKPEDLVGEYDPNDPTNPFGQRLQQISGGRAFLVFSPEGVLMALASAKLLRELLDGYNPRQTYQSDGVLHQVYAIGQRPDRFADEHPIFDKVMLRPDGKSDAHVEWGNFPLPIRQLIRVGVATGEVSGKERDVFEEVNGKTFNELTLRWPSAGVQFKKLEGAGSLPSLKVPLTTTTSPKPTSPSPK